MFLFDFILKEGNEIFMKKRIFIICMIFLSLILFFISYKFFIVGNNKSIENISEIDDFILSIGNYEIEANVTIYSNKNSNTYSLKQKKQDDYQKQEIVDNEGNGLVIENTQLISLIYGLILIYFTKYTLALLKE